MHVNACNRIVRDTECVITCVLSNTNAHVRGNGLGCTGGVVGGTGGGDGLGCKGGRC